MESYMKKIFIATPAYQGKVHVQYALALNDTCTLLRMHGFEVTIRMPVGGSLLVADRNRLLQMFWESECDYLLCVDSDLGWDPNSVMRLIQADKDVSGGVYPTRDKSGFNFRPAFEESGKIVMCKDTLLLQMEYIPAGFLLIKRNVIAKLREDYPQLYYCPKDPNSDQMSAYCFFDTEVYDGEFWGEDYVFCRRVRNAGFDIWVDPLIEFDHAGIVGSLIQVLTTDKDKAQV
jgi:hypothetical protein